MSARIGMAEAALAAVLFGTTYVGTAFALRSFTPVTVAAWRTVLAGAALALVVVAFERRSGLPDRRRAARFLVLAVINGPVFLVAMNVAIALAGPTVAAFVSGLYAILAALFAPFLLGERLGARAVGGFVIALVGTALLAELRGDPRTLAGVGVGFIAAIAFGLYLVLSRRWARSDGVTGAPVALTTSLVTCAVLFPIASATEPSAILPANPDLVAVVAVLWMGLGVSVVSQLLLLDSVKRIPARASSAFLLLNPLSAAIGAFLLLGDQLTAVQLLGAGLVLAGMAAATVPTPDRLQRAPVPAD